MSASTQSDVREGIGRHLRRLPPGHIQHRSGPDGNRQPPLGGFAAAFVLPLDTVTAIHLGRARKEFFFSLLFFSYPFGIHWPTGAAIDTTSI